MFYILQTMLPQRPNLPASSSGNPHTVA